MQLKNPYQRVYKSSGRGTKSSSSIFRYKCSAVGEKIQCPSFYKIEKLGRGSVFYVTFSIVHNHHIHQQLFLSNRGRMIVKKILIKRIENISNNIILNSETIVEEIHTSLISEEEDIGTVRAIITKKYVTSRLEKLSTEIESQLNFCDLVLKPSDDLWKDNLSLDNMHNVIILLNPQILIFQIPLILLRLLDLRI